ncbi:hypothetical protein A3J19_03590 [Candidatus Daviesbacteria bacterium RIFCSPLOWO2_02_FULL_41_8]|uniref:Uncharacterized protein n=2 Tax=Candidatus Daviesiibacteriota TaxID=1752718 RepID=A0A1F5NHG6_9BACT|nr:MAG: hypothetical protein A3D83_04055 [Candidatus Daviesbacteria bacterium RIFCSPHIGHO2_02_FULL_41_10]OGE76984.1 MAG: hypothetical protein A3J19_03590 [Candidatus Daviesbacteria bacterium RIFCSPLOWO2_02_FULL_41_8]
MDISSLKIKEEANVYHDNILDIWGNGFNFNHEKGLAEWLKNSIDAYVRIGLSDKDQFIAFRFTDGDDKHPPVIECIDYAGMTHTDIEKAFKWWGDPDAAKRGLNVKTYGGHGNGGKFYMRQMFQKSIFITFRGGRINIFGFNENRKYGFVPDFENRKISLNEALDIAGIDPDTIPENIFKKMKKGILGFTAVKGFRPKKMVGRTIPVSTICERFKYHPQARRPLKFCNVAVVHNGKMITKNLRMEDVEPLPEFKEPFVFEIPEYLEIKNSEIKKIQMSNKKYSKGRLILRTSSVPFGRGVRKAELNCIDIVGEIGVIASYKMQEIGFLRYFPQAQSIYGECSCPILEDPDYDCVQNDREKLIDNDRTQVLRNWIAEKIDEVAEKIADLERKEEERKNIETTDEFNQILNLWKNQFMSKLFAEVLGGSGRGSSTGGVGLEGSGGGSKDESEEKGGFGSGGGEGGGDGEEKKKGSTMPRVLLSGQEDPDFPGVLVTFSERHFPVEQRQQDVSRGIYWINLEKPMAKIIIDRYGVNSPRWRNYLFQRYVDIFIKETIYRLAKREGGTLTPEVADTEIMRVASLVYDKATVDLESFLLEDKFREGSNDGNKDQ